MMGLKLIFRILFVQVLLLSLWVCIPTSVFVQNTGYSIDQDGYITFTRRVPFDVRVQYFAEITLIDNNVECRMEHPQDAIIQKGPSFIKYKIGDWATDCLGKEPFIYRTIHRAYFFGLPLRASQTIAIIGERE